MKIFVTVGTTSFDSLIRAVNKIEDFDIVIQISKEASFIPKNHEYFEFTNDIDEYYRWADLIVTHAGAGSVYRLLELKKRIIIVPNLDRIDYHQTDLAQYMRDNNHAIICDDVNDIRRLLEESNTCEITPYESQSFNMAEEIVNFLLN